MKSRDGTLERVVTRRTNGGLQSVKMSAGQTIAKDPERHRTVVTKSLYPGLPKKRSQSDLLWTSVGVIVTYRPGDLRAYYDGPPYTKLHRPLGDERSGEEDGKRTCRGPIYPLLPVFTDRQSPVLLQKSRRLVSNEEIHQEEVEGLTP